MITYCNKSIVQLVDAVGRLWTQFPFYLLTYLLTYILTYLLTYLREQHVESSDVVWDRRS